MKKLIILLSIVFFVAFAIADSPCTFIWDANSETDLAGYRIYFSDAPGDYVFGGSSSPNFLVEKPCAPGDQTCCTYIKASLGGGPGYYYVATAYDINGFESLPSNEVNNLPPGQVKNFKSFK